jgi:hypothetical protein
LGVHATVNKFEFEFGTIQKKFQSENFKIPVWKKIRKNSDRKDANYFYLFLCSDSVVPMNFLLYKFTINKNIEC